MVDNRVSLGLAKVLPRRQHKCRSAPRESTPVFRGITRSVWMTHGRLLRLVRLRSNNESTSLLGHAGGSRKTRPGERLCREAHHGVRGRIDIQKKEPCCLVVLGVQLAPERGSNERKKEDKVVCERRVTNVSPARSNRSRVQFHSRHLNIQIGQSVGTRRDSRPAGHRPPLRVGEHKSRISPISANHRLPFAVAPRAIAIVNKYMQSRT